MDLELTSIEQQGLAAYVTKARVEYVFAIARTRQDAGQVETLGLKLDEAADRFAHAHAAVESEHRGKRELLN